MFQSVNRLRYVRSKRCRARIATSSLVTFGTSVTTAIIKTFLLKFGRDRRRYLRWVF
jgi:hypothetical protein